MRARVAEGLQVQADEDESEDDNEDQGPTVAVNRGDEQHGITEEGPGRMTTRSMAQQAGSSCVGVGNEE